MVSQSAFLLVYKKCIPINTEMLISSDTFQIHLYLKNLFL